MQIFRTKGQHLVEVDSICEGAWVHLEKPTDDEVDFICRELTISEDMVRAALDDEERARIETEDENLLVVMDVPVAILEDDGTYSYGTVPIGIVMTENVMVTVCTRPTGLMREFVNQRVRGFHTNKKARFTLQIMYMSSAKFLKYLRDIDKKTHALEQTITNSTSNNVLLQMMKVEKSLVYFSTALKSNEAVFERLMRVKAMKQYPEDSEILEDVIIENKQAIEMCNIYREILNGMMDAIESIISNNLNNRMKLLTAITIVLAVPTLFASLWGMNVSVPFQDNPFGFIITVILMLFVTIVVTIYMISNDMF